MAKTLSDLDALQRQTQELGRRFTTIADEERVGGAVLFAAAAQLMACALARDFIDDELKIRELLETTTKDILERVAQVRTLLKQLEPKDLTFCPESKGVH